MPNQNQIDLKVEVLMDLDEIKLPVQVVDFSEWCGDLKNHMIRHSGAEVCHYISEFIDVFSRKNKLLYSKKISDIKDLPSHIYSCIINLHKINDLPNINKFFEEVNAKLTYGGMFVGCVETYWDRDRRMFGKFPKPVSSVLIFLDFIFSRMFPKIKTTRKFYYFITHGRNRAISKAEALGRLVSCGFEIVEYRHINGLKYFIGKKVKEPSYDMNPSYGPLFRMKRIGKNGKIIGVYKLRTMHPYSEYLQEYIFSNNNLDKGGKFNDDFRVSALGSFLRKFWIDELPMIINLLRGEMKLVGVRPLSEQYFSLYSKELQQKRIRFKPGLIPPYYADMPGTLEEIMASELKYLERYEKHPFITDLRYLFKSLGNILLRKARSK